MDAETTAARPAGALEPAPIVARLAALADEHGLAGAGFKPAALTWLKAWVRERRSEAEAQLLASGGGTACAQRLSDIQDTLIRAFYGFASSTVYPAVNPSAAERIGVVAVGGYGRATLAPGSDIDLLFLLPYKQTAWGESVVEWMLYMLWDMGFKVGHATRSVDECIRLARTDSTIMTAVLEARYICGDRALFDELERRYRAEIMPRDVRTFITDKLAERDRRHLRAGESRYLVEPDVKDGKGGMRDLQTLFWIAKFIYSTRSPADLVDAGVFNRDELARFSKCEDFLWAVRCHLHFMTGRGDDRLSFDKQAELAERLGYTARGGLRAAERLMRHYFLIAKDVGDLTRIFSAVLEAQQIKQAPAMSGLIARFRRKRLTGAEARDFRMEAGRLAAARDDIFVADPVNLLRLFHIAQRHNVAVHPDTLKMVRRSLRLVDAALRNDAEANRLFLDMLCDRGDAEAVLRRMNEAGVLGRFIPEFGHIVALMQFNMYHHYTVDEHLLRTVGILAQIERGVLADEHPLSSDLISTIVSRRVLYVAAFLHDIGKGRKESHSAAGARIAQTLGPRLGLTASETETVAWLVRHHLLMSETAQMRDLSDYKTILDFVAVVQSPERLKLLLILTVADIRAVGPGVWNGWKGQLLRTLYFEAEPVLSGGHSSLSRQDRVAAAQKAFRDAMSDWTYAEACAYIARHYDAYWTAVDLRHQIADAHLLHRAAHSGEPIAVAVALDQFTAVTEITVYAPDHPRLLARLTGACAAGGANIVGAKIFTTVDGMALDTVLIQREFDDETDERRRAARLTQLIHQALRGELRLREAVAAAARPRGRIKAFTVEPQVVVDNESSNRFTVIEVAGLDRIGLLYELTDALFQLNLNIASAQITTFGERAVDVFYVTDLTGQKIVSAGRRNAVQRQLMAVLTPDRSGDRAA